MNGENPNNTIDDKDLGCAPSKPFENGSCIPLYLLVEMAHAYNKTYQDPKKQIKLDPMKELLNSVEYKKYLLSQFNKRVDDVCENQQQRWVKQTFVKKMQKKMRDELEKETFRPVGPGGKFTWLNTNDINKVAKQYEAKYSEFKFLGAVPMDFDDLPQYGIKDLDFDKLMRENKTKIGVVFNLDNSWQGGSHWVGLYIDLKKGCVFFSDSYGTFPPDRVIILMRRIAKFIKHGLGKTPIVDYNKLQHQSKGSECGVFSIAFVLRMLRGDSWEELTTKRVPDEEINQCRSYYFSAPK